jgi:hypothetical protein
VPRSPLTADKIRRPDLLFKEILRKGAQGLYSEIDENPQVFMRALVLAVDVDGGKLENPDGRGSISHELSGRKIEFNARIGPENPPGSIKARVITEGYDKFSDDDEAKIFWPLFPETLSIPVKPGEHVYVVFEDVSMQHGLWISKVAGHEGVNFARGKEFYKETNSSSKFEKFDDTKGSNEKKYNEDQDSGENKQTKKLVNSFEDLK